MKLIEYMVPMTDGVRLHTPVWQASDDPAPVILQRGYAPGNERDAPAFVDAGYTFVGQSTRGHMQSEGEMNRFFDDAHDGYDALTWVADQPWCDGNIAMYGRSYYAQTQWLVAPRKHPNLRAIVPQHMNPDMWECAYWNHGALNLAMTVGGRMEARDHSWEEILWHLPLIDTDLYAQGSRNKLWQDYITNSTARGFWDRISVLDYSAIDIPVYLMSGWYDYYANAAVTAYNALKASQPDRELRLVIDPSNHVRQIRGDRDFGGDPLKDEVALAVRWLDWVIRGVDTGVAEEPPIRIFRMGTNEWRDETAWPPDRTESHTWYLHSESGDRSGVLSESLPSEETPTHYTYDPADPVPSLGGNHSADQKADFVPICRSGSVDQRPNEVREDVLVFTTAPFARDVEVSGPVVLELWASSSVLDTDFIGRLIDVAPDGTAFNLCEGVLRTRFRHDLYGDPTLMTPGEIFPFTVHLGQTCNVFKKGHALRLHVTSSGFPLWDRNPNTGHEQGVDSELRVAQQTIYHDQDHPSYLLVHQR